MAKTKRVGIRLSDRRYQKLQKICEQRDRPITVVIEDLIDSVEISDADISHD